MKKLIALLLALVMVVALVACGAKKEEAPAPAPAPEAGTEQPSGEVDLTKGDSYTIRVAHSMTDQSSYHKSIEQEFKSVIEEKTGGRITVEIYPSSQLGGERQAFEGVGMGTIEMTLVNGANVANVDPNYAVFDFPFLFDTAEAVYAAMDGEVGAVLKESIKRLPVLTGDLRLPVKAIQTGMVVHRLCNIMIT